MIKYLLLREANTQHNDSYQAYSQQSILIFSSDFTFGSSNILWQNSSVILSWVLRSSSIFPQWNEVQQVELQPKNDVQSSGGPHDLVSQDIS